MSAIRDCVFFKETPSLLEEATTPRAQVIATSFYLMREFTSQLNAPLTSLPDKDDLHDLLSTYALQLFKETTIPWLVIPAAPGRGRGEMREALVQVCLETLMLSKSKPKKEQGKTVTARIVTAKKEAKKIAAPEMEPQGRVDGVSNPRKRSCRRYEGFAYRGHCHATGTTSKRTRTGASAQPPCESSAKDVISLLSDSDDGSEPIKPTTRGGRANRASSSYLIRADNELNGADAGSDEEYSPGQSDKEASPHTDSEGGMSAFPHHEASVAAFKFAQSITKWPAMGHVPYIAGGISGEKKGLRVCNDKMFYSWYLLSPEGNRAPWNNETHSFRYDLTKSTFNGHGFLNYLRDAGVSARHLVAMTSYILAISVAQESELQTKKHLALRPKDALKFVRKCGFEGSFRPIYDKVMSQDPDSVVYFCASSACMRTHVSQAYVTTEDVRRHIKSHAAFEGMYVKNYSASVRRCHNLGCNAVVDGKWKSWEDHSHDCTARRDD